MDRITNWLKVPFGKKLKKLHAWNAWIVLVLAVTGIILYIPALRGPIAPIRVALKNIHILFGLLSIGVILLYLPQLFKHVKVIKHKLNQQSNLAIVLFLLIGWAISGVILWQERNLSKGMTYAALVLHDLFTWIGVPWVSYHSLVRSRWLKESARNKEDALSTYVPVMSRRRFIRNGVGLIMLAAIGPYFYRWLISFFQSGGEGNSPLESVASGNVMLPAPQPSADSLKPIGGGSEGRFRVYSVTPIPSFTSKDWEFSVGGLVQKPITLNWQQFLNIPRKVQVSDFHCVTGWSVFYCTWEGIPLTHFLDAAGVDKKAKYVKFYSGDDLYTDTLSLEQTQMKDITVAVLRDGKPIARTLGGPVRLIVPQMYAYKSVKWLQKIELIEQADPGFWEVRGYDTDAWVKRS